MLERELYQTKGRPNASTPIQMSSSNEARVQPPASYPMPPANFNQNTNPPVNHVQAPVAPVHANGQAAAHGQFSGVQAFTPSGQQAGLQPPAPSGQHAGVQASTPNGQQAGVQAFTPNGQHAGVQASTPNGQHAGVQASTPSGQHAGVQASTPSGQQAQAGMQPPAPSGYGSTIQYPQHQTQAEAYFQQAYHSSQSQASSYGVQINQRAKENNLESILVKFVLPIVFVIILLIGILLLFVAGVTFGLITEPVRFFLGSLLAVIMYVVGYLLFRNGRTILGKSLLGGGHGTFIITISVAHLSYELFGVATATLLYLLSCSLIIGSAWKWRSELLISIAVVTGFLCAFLLDVTQVHVLAFILCQLLFSVSMMVLSKAMNYRISYSLAYLLLHAALVLSYNHHHDMNGVFMIGALLVQLFAILIPYVKHKHPYTELHFMQALGVLSVICWAIFLLNRDVINELFFLLLTGSIGAAYGLLVFMFERRGITANGKDPSSFYAVRTQLCVLITSFSLLCLFTQLLGVKYLDLLLYLFGFLLIMYGLRDRYQALLYTGAVLGFFGTTAIMFNSANVLFSYEVLCWFVVLAGIWSIYIECRKLTTNNSEKHYSTLLPILIWGEAFIGLWITTKLAHLIGEVYGSIEAQPYFVSFAWLIYAVGAITIGTVRNLSKARLTGIILLLVLVIKVIFIDITFLNLLYKSILFTVLGSVGILVSYVLYNRSTNNK